MPRKLIAALFASALVLSACGDDDPVTTTGQPDDTTATTESTTTDPRDYGGSDGSSTTTPSDDGAAAGDALVSTASTDLGDVLVDGDGLTLYGFTNDSPGTSSCEGGCADTWPPLVVESSEVPEGLDASVFSVLERPDGSFQLQAGDWPLYTYAADAAPGDTSGQGVGGVWFAVDPQGELIEG